MLPEPETRGDEGRFAGTWQNKAAGQALRAARLSLGRLGGTQSAFAARLSEQLGISISPTTLSGWETGRRTVPVPVWMAAAVVTGQLLEAPAGVSSTEATAPTEPLALARQLGGQDAVAIAELTEQIQTLRQQYAALYAQVVEAFMRAGLPFPEASTQTLRRQSRETYSG